MRRYRNFPKRGPFVFKKRGGATAVEMALALPVMVTIVLGCVDFGRFAYMHISVNNAARAGAGIGIMKRVTAGSMGVWGDAITQAVKDEMAQQSHYDESKLTVPSPTLTNEGGGFRRVRVEVRYQFNTLAPWPGIPSQVTLSRAVEMRMIR